MAGRRVFGEIEKRGQRYRARYVGPDLVRHAAPATFSEKLLAEDWLTDERHLIEKGEWTPPAERQAAKLRAVEIEAEAPTVASFGMGYVTRDDLSPTSQDRYQQLLRFYIIGEPMPSRRKKESAKVIIGHPIGGIRMTALTKADVRAWWQGLPLRQRESSCRQAYDLLRAIANAAVYEEIISQTPVALKKASKPSKESQLEPLPIWALYLVAGKMPERLRLGVLIGGVLGLRSGEVRALRRENVDLERGTIRVEYSVKEPKGRLLIGPTKTDQSQRTMVVPEALMDDLRAHLRDHAQIGNHGLLFYDPEGRPIRSGNWLKIFKKACRAAAEEMYDERVRKLLTQHGGYIFHGTRSTALTMAYRASGGNLKAVQRFGGHTNPKSALRYQRVDQEYLTGIAEDISDMIESSRDTSMNPQQEPEGQVLDMRRETTT